MRRHPFLLDLNSGKLQRHAFLILDAPARLMVGELIPVSDGWVRLMLFSEEATTAAKNSATKPLPSLEH
jgi:hypothetical protein